MSIQQIKSLPILNDFNFIDFSRVTATLVFIKRKDRKTGQNNYNFPYKFQSKFVVTFQKIDYCNGKSVNFCLTNATVA